MPEFIERDAAIEAAKHAWAKDLEPSQYIEALPAADVAPVIRATWVFTTDFGPSELYHCSRCGREEVRFGKSSIYKQYPYCHCGAKMDGGADHACL